MSLIIYYKIDLSDTILSIELPIDATVKTVFDTADVDYKKYMFTYNDINYFGSSEEPLADLGMCSETTIYFERIPKKKAIVMRLLYQEGRNDTTILTIDSVGVIFNLSEDSSERQIIRRYRRVVQEGYLLCNNLLYENKYYFMTDLGDHDELFGDKPIDKKFFGNIPVLELLRTRLKANIPENTKSPYEWTLKNIPHIIEQLGPAARFDTGIVIQEKFDIEKWDEKGIPEIPVCK